MRIRVVRRAKPVVLYNRKRDGIVSTRRVLRSTLLLNSKFFREQISFFVGRFNKNNGVGVGRRAAAGGPRFTNRVHATL